jgi:hypothetical protein
LLHATEVIPVNIMTVMVPARDAKRFDAMLKNSKRVTGLGLSEFELAK